MFCEHAAQKGLGRLPCAVRVLGKDFDISLGVVADVRQLRQGRQAVRPAADRGGSLGLHLRPSEVAPPAPGSAPERWALAGRPRRPGRALGPSGPSGRDILASWGHRHRNGPLRSMSRRPSLSRTGPPMTLSNCPRSGEARHGFLERLPPGYAEQTAPQVAARDWAEIFRLLTRGQRCRAGSWPRGG